MIGDSLTLGHHTADFDGSKDCVSGENMFWICRVILKDIMLKTLLGGSPS